MSAAPVGTVYLVGAGPGAPDLLTLRAAKLLAAADVVFHDALVHLETLELAPQAEKIAVGKRCGRHSTAQKFIDKRLIDAAQKHDVVVRLKGGDPMLFGRAQEEIEALTAAGVRCEVVPGVTAALAASAELGIPLTQRGVARSVTLVTPRVGEGEKSSEWIESVVAADAAAIYMGAGHAEEIAAALIGAGKPPETPIAIVENISLSSMRTRYATLSTLPGIAHTGIAGPALILVGPQFRTAARAASTPPPAIVQNLLRASVR